MSAPQPAPAMSQPAPLQASSGPEPARERRSSIGRAFKRFKTAFQKIGGSSRESTSQQQHAAGHAAPMDMLIVDEEADEPTLISTEAMRR
jgi:hypothetical protein